jgi:hypothetical protein
MGSVTSVESVVDVSSITPLEEAGSDSSDTGADDASPSIGSELIEELSDEASLLCEDAEASVSCKEAELTLSPKSSEGSDSLEVVVSSGSAEDSCMTTSNPSGRVSAGVSSGRMCPDVFCMVPATAEGLAFTIQLHLIADTGIPDGIAGKRNARYIHGERNTT